MSKLRLALSLWLLNAVSFGAEIQRVCVAASYEEATPPVLKENALVQLHVFAKGLTGCVSGSAYRGPGLKKNGDRSYELIGEFSPTHAKVLTPDCGGNLQVHSLGRLERGDYQVKFAGKTLKFHIPTKASEVCSVE